MRKKLTAALLLALVALSLLAVPVRPSAAQPTAAQPTVTVGLYCIPLGRNRLECHADASGGVGGYTFQWTPTPLAGGFSEGLAIIYCPGTSYRNISVTVTDANGSTASAGGLFYCCGSCDPL